MNKWGSTTQPIFGLALEKEGF